MYFQLFPDGGGRKGLEGTKGVSDSCEPPVKSVTTQQGLLKQLQSQSSDQVLSNYPVTAGKYNTQYTRGQFLVQLLGSKPKVTDRGPCFVMTASLMSTV
jgi:hypothetical protein